MGLSGTTASLLALAMLAAGLPPSMAAAAPGPVLGPGVLGPGPVPGSGGEPLALPALAASATPTFGPRTQAVPPLGLPPLPAAGPLAGPLASATYVACGQLAGQALRCSEPVAFGSPVQLDLDGASGPEVQVQLAPFAAPVIGPALLADPAAALAALPAVLHDLSEEAQVPGLGVTLRIGALAPADSTAVPCAGGLVNDLPDKFHLEADCFLRLPTLENNLLPAVPGPDELLQGDLGDAAALAARVYAVYRLADELTGSDATTVIRLGVDGTTSTLPETSTFRFRVREPQSLLAGRAVADFGLDFVQPGPEVRVFAEWSRDDGSGQPLDPTSVGLTMAPVPNFHGHADVRLDGSSLAVDLEASLEPVLTVAYDSQDTDPGEPSTTHAEATFDRLPLVTRVEYDRLPAADGEPSGARVLYRGSSVVDTVTGMFHRTEAGPVAQHGTLLVDDLPGEVSVELRAASGRGRLGYSADADLPRLEAGFAFTDEEGTTVQGQATLHDLPTRVDATWDTAVPEGEPERITYDASAGFGPMTFHLDNGPQALALAAEVASMPPYLETRFMDNYVAFDARSSAAAPPASGTVGQANVRFATDGALFTSGLPGDHVDVLYGTEVRADLQYTGLRSLSVDLRPDPQWGSKAVIEARSAAPRVLAFRAMLPETVIHGTIDAVPTHVAVEYRADLGSFRYDPHGETVAKVDLAYLKLTSPVRNILAVIEDISATVDVAYEFTYPPYKLDVTGEGSIGRLQVDACIGGLVGSCGLGLEVVAEATAIPAELHAEYLELGEAMNMVYQAGAAIGSLRLEFRDPHGIFPDLGFEEVIAELTALPTRFEVMATPNQGLVVDTFGQGSITGRFLAHRDLPIGDLAEDNFVHLVTCDAANPCTNGKSGLEGLLVKVGGLTKLVMCQPPDCGSSGAEVRAHVRAEFVDPTEFRVLHTLWAGSTAHHPMELHVDQLPEVIDLEFTTTLTTYYDAAEDPDHGNTGVNPTKELRLNDLDYQASGDGHLALLRFPMGDPLGGKHITFSDAAMGPKLHVDFDSYTNKLCDFDQYDHDRTDAIHIGIATEGSWTVGTVAVWLPDAEEGDWLDVTGVALLPGGGDAFAADAMVCMAPDEALLQDVVSGTIDLTVEPGRLLGQIKVGSIEAGVKKPEDVRIPFCDGGWRGHFLAMVNEGLFGAPTLTMLAETNHEGDFGIEITDPIGDQPGCGVT